jgi:O-methyltransferase
MQSDIVRQQIDKYGLVSNQVDKAELLVVLEELSKSLKIDGAVVEFGCYVGTTSLYIRRLLDYAKDMREFHVYDSFEGLPAKSVKDYSAAGEQFKEGELTVTKKQFIHEFKKARLDLPRIHKGWFNQLEDIDVPSPISFAFLDGDYYESVMTPLKLIESKLAPGATIVVDDYASEALPGAARAVDEWCKLKGYSVRVVKSLAIIYCTD